MKLLPYALFAAFSLSTLWAAMPAHAQEGRVPLPTEPVGCVIFAAWEDRSALAVCMNGETIAYDPDGNYAARRGPGWYRWEGVIVLRAGGGWTRIMEVPR